MTLARETLEVDAGVIVPAGGGRGVFVVPWLGRTLVGTTDNDYEGSLEHVPPSDDDIAYLLEALNGFFETELSVADLTAPTGVRPPIPTGDPKKSVDISRKAELYETSSGWRRSPAASSPPGVAWPSWRWTESSSARSARRPAAHTRSLLGLPVDPDELQHVPSVDAHSREHLARRYGHAAQFVLRLAEAEPELGRRITPGLPDICAEAAFAAAHEQAQSVGDVLLRRTRLGILDTSPRRRARRRGRWRGDGCGARLGRGAHPRRARRVGGARPQRGPRPGARSAKEAA